MTPKRPAIRIKKKPTIVKKSVSSILLENQKNIAGRIRYLVTQNPDITVIEFIARSRYKNPENKKIIDLLKKEFGDLKITELKTPQIDYLFAMYTEEPELREQAFKRMMDDKLRLSYRITIQRIDFVNKCKKDKAFGARTDLLLHFFSKNAFNRKTLKTEEPVLKVFGNIKLKYYNNDANHYWHLQKEFPDLTLNEIKQLTGYKKEN